MSTITPDKLKALHAPFPSNQISWKPGAMDAAKTMAQALPYVDNRVIQNRLDDVVGAENWQTEYVEVVGQGRLIAVRCTLSLNVGGNWIKKADAAPPSPIGPDEALGADVSIKGAYSDAMKRAAVHWGMGRYLYDYVPPMVPIDQQQKIILPPSLPAHMLPEGDIALAETDSKSSTLASADTETPVPKTVLQENEVSSTPASGEPATEKNDSAPAAPGPVTETMALQEPVGEQNTVTSLDPAKSDEYNLALLAEPEVKIATQFLQRILNSETHQRMKDYIDGPAAKEKLSEATQKFLKARLTQAITAATGVVENPV